MDLRPVGPTLITPILSSRSQWLALCWLWLRFSIRRLSSNPLRLLIVLISVALATSLASAVLRVSVASIDSFERSISGTDHPYHAVISPVGGRLSLDQLAPCLSVLSAKADILGIRREPGIVRFGSAEIPIRVAGIAAFSAGSPNALEAGLDSRVVTPELADKLAVLESALVTLKVSGQMVEIPVRRASQKQTIAGYADLVIPLSDLAPSTALDSIALRLKESSGAELTKGALPALEQWLSSCLSPGPPLRVESIDTPIERGAQLLDAYRFNISVMTLITLLVCAILISQATQITVYGIVRELAIIRTLGVSKNATLAIVVVEATVISFVGAIIGVILAAPLVVWIASFLTSTASEIYNVSLKTSAAISAESSVIAVLIMTTVGTVSAFIGARSVARLPPYRGTRREYRTVQPLKGSVVTISLALTSFALVSLIVLLVIRPTSLIAYLVIGMVLIWAPTLLALLLYLTPNMARWLRRYFAARLALGALRTSATSFLFSGVAVTVAISLIVGLSLMVGSFRQTLTRWSAIRLAGDIFISSSVSGSGNEVRLAPGIAQQIANLSGVKRVIPYFETAATINQQSVVIGGVELRTQCERQVYSFISGQCIPAADSWSGQAIASESAARKLGVRIGSQIIVAGARYTVRGTFQEFGTEQPLIVIDRLDFESTYRGHNPETLTVDLFNSLDLEKIKSLIQQLAPITITVRDQRQLLDLVETLFNRTFRVADSVRAIVFLMAILGLLSTTAQYTWERRRELKVAHVVGVTHTTLVASLTLEVAAVALMAIIGGVSGGVIIGWCLTAYINPLVFGWGLSFTLSARPIVEALMFVAGVVVAMWLLAQIMVGRIVRSAALGDE